MAVYTAIDDPEAYFQVKLYTGDGSIQAITLDGDTDMQPDFIWCKSRGETRHHYLADSIRGVKSRLRSDVTNAEYTANATSGFDSFDSDGFTLEADSSSLGLNESSHNMVAWCWKESATSGFDIVTFTGTGTTANISHGLSVAPKMIIVKSKTGASGWRVYHEGATATKALVLDTTAAADGSIDYWNNTAPTSSVFTVRANSTNDNTATMMAYCFADVQGFSKFGSYTGNGNADGPFIYTGFSPAYIMIKTTSGTDNWIIFDNKRPADSNPCHDYVKANANAAEDTDDADLGLDFISGGFKLRGNNAAISTSGGTYVYLAFAEAPLVNSEGVPCNAR